ncbi:MAG: hypothetical protein K0R63_1780 [Rickettsiales bacterium]|jgi:hypothetical protein|nr:hypothetical protein [Rickettsiales bacterium]
MIKALFSKFTGWVKETANKVMDTFGIRVRQRFFEALEKKDEARAKEILQKASPEKVKDISTRKIDKNSRYGFHKAVEETNDVNIVKTLYNAIPSDGEKQGILKFQNYRALRLEMFNRKKPRILQFLFDQIPDKDKKSCIMKIATMLGFDYGATRLIYSQFSPEDGLEILFFQNEPLKRALVCGTVELVHFILDKYPDEKKVEALKNLGDSVHMWYPEISKLLLAHMLQLNDKLSEEDKIDINPFLYGMREKQKEITPTITTQEILQDVKENKDAIFAMAEKRMRHWDDIQFAKELCKTPAEGRFMQGKMDLIPENSSDNPNASPLLTLPEEITQRIESYKKLYEMGYKGENVDKFVDLIGPRGKVNTDEIYSPSNVVSFLEGVRQQEGQSQKQLPAR